MNCKQLLTGALIGLVSCGTFAASEWKVIDSDNTGFLYLIDTNSINQFPEYSSQATHKAWIKRAVYNDLEQDGLAVGDYYMVLYWVHCNNRTLGAKSATSYKKQKNGFVKNDSQSVNYVEMRDVIPDSMGEGIFDAVCS